MSVLGHGRSAVLGSRFWLSPHHSVGALSSGSSPEAFGNPYPRTSPGRVTTRDSWLAGCQPGPLGLRVRGDVLPPWPIALPGSHKVELVCASHGAHVAAEEGAEEVPVGVDAAGARMASLRQGLFQLLPAYAGLGQRGGPGGVLVGPAAGALSLAACPCDERTRRPVPVRTWEAFLPSDVAQVLAAQVAPLGQELVQQLAVLCLATLGEHPVSLGQGRLRFVGLGRAVAP